MQITKNTEDLGLTCYDSTKMMQALKLVKTRKASFEKMYSMQKESYTMNFKEQQQDFLECTQKALALIGENIQVPYS